MRVEAFLTALRRMPLAPAPSLTEGKPFVVLSPHPDDESLGVGGVIAAARAKGQRVDIVILTDGSGSHPHSLTHPRDKLVDLRRAEAERAAVHLGVSPDRLVHLGLSDTQTPSAGPAFERSVERIVAIIDDADANALFVTWGGDPHCDHEAADQIARAVRRRRPHLKLWSYPIWGWGLDPAAEIDEPPPRGARIDVSAWLSSKHAAIAAHASQMTDLIDDDPTGFRFDERTLAPFLGPYEYLFEVPA
jgi:LmbE family N-acetylglucosaminyl deacetylase